MDDWRMMPQLTLNYGVRYEFFAPLRRSTVTWRIVQSDPTGRSKPLPRRRRWRWAAGFAGVSIPRGVCGSGVGLGARTAEGTVVQAGSE